MMRFRLLSAADLSPGLLSSFRHRQLIRRKWVRRADWELCGAAEVREWDREKREWIPEYLRWQLERGGSALAAYSGDELVGFCALDGCLSGETARYANLTMLFVDDGWQGQGVGKALFRLICVQARKLGAEKLFLSAIPSEETVAFYFHIGCTDAAEIIPDFTDTEEDRYLEFSLYPPS